MVFGDLREVQGDVPDWFFDAVFWKSRFDGLTRLLYRNGTQNNTLNNFLDSLSSFVALLDNCVGIFVELTNFLQKSCSFRSLIGVSTVSI